jgi:hypothetical protein
MECIKEDLAEKKLKTRGAANRPCWRSLTKNSDPTYSEKSLGKKKIKVNKKFRTLLNIYPMRH